MSERKLQRNLSTEEGRRFWENVAKSAASLDKQPAWVSAGVELGCSRRYPPKVRWGVASPQETGVKVDGCGLQRCVMCDWPKGWDQDWTGSDICIACNDDEIETTD